MGAWGHGILENDGALDWLDEFEAEPAEAILDEILSPIESGDYLDVDACSAGLVASEILAHALGNGSTDLPGGVVSWIQKHGSVATPARVGGAISFIDRVLADSEMQALWDETEHADKWRAAVRDLRARLASAPKN